MANPSEGTLGIDIGGTKTFLSLFDHRYRALSDIKMKTRVERGQRHFSRALSDAAHELQRVAKKNGLKIAAVGVGCAGRADNRTGVIRFSPNIPFMKNYPLRQTLEKVVKAPVTIVNDVQAGLMGEHAFGAARGCDNAIGLFLGTGIGGALILNGRLFTGSTGSAGEIGRYLTDPMGPLAGSERHGVLDDVVNRLAIAGEAAIMASKQWAPHLYKAAGADVTRITSSVIAKAVHAGDKPVESLVRSRARILGIVMANLANFLSPDVIVLGGGLVDVLPELISGEADAAMRPYLTEDVRRHVRVRPAQLRKHAIPAGAAKMARDAAT